MTKYILNKQRELKIKLASNTTLPYLKTPVPSFNPVIKLFSNFLREYGTYVIRYFVRITKFGTESVA